MAWISSVAGIAVIIPVCFVGVFLVLCVLCSCSTPPEDRPWNRVLEIRRRQAKITRELRIESVNQHRLYEARRNLPNQSMDLGPFNLDPEASVERPRATYSGPVVPTPSSTSTTSPSLLDRPFAAGFARRNLESTTTPASAAIDSLPPYQRLDNLASRPLLPEAEGSGDESETPPPYAPRA